MTGRRLMSQPVTAIPTRMAALTVLSTGTGTRRTAEASTGLVNTVKVMRIGRLSASAKPANTLMRAIVPGPTPWRLYKR